MTAQVHQFPTDADRLATIAKEIQRELADASHSAIESAIKIGERLIEAKNIAGHGKFIPWLEQNFHTGKDQAGKYMKAARHADELRAKANSGLAFTLNTIPALLALPADPDDEPKAKSGKSNSKPKDRTGTKIGKALDALREAGPKGLTASELIKAGGIKSPAGLDRQVVSGEMIKAENGRLYAPDFAPDVALPELSLTQQQKLDAWRRRLEAEFDARVEQVSKENSQKWLDEVRIPIYEQKIAKLVRMLEWPSNTVMTKAEYNIIMKCLHPDGIKSRTEEQLAEAFRIFTKYRPKLASDEETRKAVLHELPRSREELLARKKAKL